jgi:hypothetical protein
MEREGGSKIDMRLDRRGVEGTVWPERSIGLSIGGIVNGGGLSTVGVRLSTVGVRLSTVGTDGCLSTGGIRLSTGGIRLSVGGWGHPAGVFRLSSEGSTIVFVLFAYVVE